ncbi:diguanylate cyclase [Marinimicrobium agarilyticum]|uniref:diguanylate cyclase n=1 Tax=Marinimicrobium agarilyticum TaxID=306546 RepID=UPI0003F8BECA|nr:diguanylate cyclase [Marinimicrobium agarilyticum]
MLRLSIVFGLLLGLSAHGGPASAEENADQSTAIEQVGRWVSPAPTANTATGVPTAAQLIPTEVSPAGGGVLWYELTFALSEPTELVLDFASSSTLNHFIHILVNDQGEQIKRIEGGLRFGDRYDYFLRHGRRLSLPEGNYRVLTRMESPFYLALPEPHLFERAYYEQQIVRTQSLTLAGLGIFFGLLFYYAVMAVWRRSRTDGLYALFILGNLLYNGAAMLVYSQLFGWTWFYLISTPILFSNAVYIGFVMRLLGVDREHHPALFWLGITLLGILASFWPLALLWPNWSLEFCRIGVAIFALYGLLCGITCSLQGHRVARLYLIANAAFAIPALIAISLESTSNPLYLVEHLGMVAVLIEVLLLAQVVSYQIGQVYRERAGSQASLERGKLLDNLTAQAPGVVYQFEMTPEGRFAMPFASRRLTEYIEVTPEEVRENVNRLFARAHPQDYKDIVASIISSARHLTTWHQEFRAVMPIQGMRWLEGNAEPERLPDGTTRWYGFISDVTERKQMEEHMRHMAQHDPLTNLPNRALFSDRLDQALKSAGRYGERVALMFIDLDGFKIINDHYGHDLGDELLKLVSQAMTVNLRAADTVARMGGDEFVVLLDSITGQEEALKVAEKIRKTCEAPFRVEGHTLHIATSLGLALYPEHAGDTSGLMRAADQAMYRAKDAGGNQVVIAKTTADWTEADL